MKKKSIHWTSALLLLCCLLTAHSSVEAETNVTQSVSVSANGGESHASVKTVINGEVVEDWSATSNEPIEYSQTISTTNATTTTEISTNPTQQKTDAQLKEIISQLQALIAFYVSLLNP